MSETPYTPGNRISAALAFLLPPLVLSGWGVVMLHTWATGRTRTLLHPFFQPMIAAAGVLLLLLALAHLFYFTGKASRTRLVQWFVLLVPLLAAAATAPRSFSDRMIAARGVQTTSTVLNSSTLDANADLILKSVAESDPGKPLPIDVVDLVTASNIPEVTQKLEGRTLRMRGQLYKPSGGQYKLLRLLMYCCAADATPVGVKIVGEAPPEVKSMEWIEVEGPVRFIQSLGQVHPEVTATSAHAVAAPSNPYAY